jgi:hypothetical protein
LPATAAAVWRSRRCSGTHTDNFGAAHGLQERQREDRGNAESPSKPEWMRNFLISGQSFHNNTSEHASIFRRNVFRDIEKVQPVGNSCLPERIGKPIMFWRITRITSHKKPEPISQKALK